MKKIYILDTNVLLEDNEAIDNLRNGEDDNTIVIPYSVIVELDRVKEKLNKAYLVSNIIDKIISDDKIIIPKRIEYKYNKENCKDESIIDDIKRFIELLKENNGDVGACVVVSNDKIFRLRMKIELPNLETQEYKNSKPFISDTDIYTGYIRVDEPIVNNCFVLNENKIWWEKTEDFIDNAEIWSLKPRTVYQNMAMHLLMDDDIKVVSIASQAGAGKTLLTLAAAIQITQQKTNNIELKQEDCNTDTHVKKRGRKSKDKNVGEKISSVYKKIIVVRPTTIIGDELGFLPGDLNEKLDPYFRPIRDLIFKLHEYRPCNRLFNDNDPKNGFNSKYIEFIPITYIRGMNIENAIVIIDECQNLSRQNLRALLSRMGENVRCFLTGDISQVDHKYLDSSNNGLNWVLRKFKGQREYAHLTMKSPKSRGPITDLVIKTNL